MLLVKAQPRLEEWVGCVQKAVPNAAQSLLLAEDLLGTEGPQQLRQVLHFTLQMRGLISLQQQLSSSK